MLPILNGNYNDFNVQWYFDVGSQICQTLVLDIAIINMINLANAALSWFWRCRDRQCSSRVKNNEDDEADDFVNT